MQEPVTVDVNRDATVANVTIPIAGTGTDEASVAALEVLRKEIVPATVGGLSNAESGVTGLSAQWKDGTDKMTSKLPLARRGGESDRAQPAVGGCGLRRPVIVFQYGFAKDLLGFSSTAGIDPVVPLLLFVILFGLSMDDHVLVLGRIREAYYGGQTMDDAISSGIKRTAGVVTSAAVVMVGVFSIFGVLSMLFFKQFSVGLANAILIDATIIRAVLLPATMKLLGSGTGTSPRGSSGFLISRAARPSPRRRCSRLRRPRRPRVPPPAQAGGGTPTLCNVTQSSVAERYVRLGLQLGRHVDGIVDAYFGPRELAAAVEAEPPVDPRTLVSAAEALLDELEDGWLRDQVVGLRTYAGVLAGESGSYADEVEGCYGVRPTYTDEAVFTAAHERLEELVPGDGTLAERYERWESSIRVPTELVEGTMAAVIEEARGWTRGLVELPDGEGVVLEIVRDEAWMGFCAYLGDLRSRIAVNVDLPISAIDFLHLAVHETYAGHHTERCCKEHLLVRGRGLLEETIVMVPAPQSLISEGIAKLAQSMLLEGDSGAALAAVMHDAGIELDLAHALAVGRAMEPCRWAEVNAALMLHDAGATEAETHAYLERWGLLTPELAAHVIRFLTEPTSRSYILTYAAGRDLCRSYAAGEPRRFRRLLTEQVRVRDLLEAQDAAEA